MQWFFLQETVVIQQELYVGNHERMATAAPTSEGRYLRSVKSVQTGGARETGQHPLENACTFFFDWEMVTVSTLELTSSTKIGETD